MFDVVSFGTATLDVFLRSSGMKVSESEIDKNICVRYGAKIEVDEIFFESGGGATNSVVTFSRQGLLVGCVAQIGDDFAGNKILTDLAKENIGNNLFDVQKGSYTDYSTILWAGDGGRTVLIYRGKSRLEMEEIKWEELDSKWFYISSLEGNLEVVKKLTDLGKPVAWNPGGRELAQKESLISLLPKITQLNVNKEEMEELLGMGKVEEIKELLIKAQTLPCKYVVITDDRRGAYLWDKESSSWYHSGIFEDSPRLETTGAGDAFGSGLVTGFIKNLSLEDSLWLASANASSVITQVGAKKGILKTRDLGFWPKEKLRIEKITF
ncbi:hypothetical protein COS54_02800 [Candidatus Shapirobacteria bacterium CG03_land_8_20_14_0_80_39_12]|uniref:Carbohydrate kinase PfkB domain-containing protein n=1 Tax=Candidatus Shapirobacteria bacterium CG03_land_8_20_14_0_80_39_12 TaxID=1974879 RepID=A0A2M7BBU8_9BACT|nr:MAG: hypothetical protein COS54_02800 [Candidatus Shapirobacteria bacterium CG03_land_8_20_14_0_80_39_12]